jgi:hypothetical protein
MDYLFARSKPGLERDLGHELSQQIFVENPAGAFALKRTGQGAASSARATMEVMW